VLLLILPSDPRSLRLKGSRLIRRQALPLGMQFHGPGMVMKCVKRRGRHRQGRRRGEWGFYVEMPSIQ
jgi:hypothetical protein